LGDRWPHELHREPHQNRKDDGLREEGCIDVHRNAFLQCVVKSGDALAAAPAEGLRPDREVSASPAGAAGPGSKPHQARTNGLAKANSRAMATPIRNAASIRPARMNILVCRSFISSG